jgi:hypothetical protein
MLCYICSKPVTVKIFVVTLKNTPRTFVLRFFTMSCVVGKRNPKPVLACPLLSLIYLYFYKLLMYV